MQGTTEKKPEHDLIYVDRRTPAHPWLWYLVWDSYDINATIIYPPNHPAREIYLKRGSMKYTLQEIRGHNTYHVPDKLRQIVDNWINIWYVHDRMPLDSEPVQRWARRMCVYWKHCFYLPSGQGYRIEKDKHPMDDEENSVAIYNARVFYDDFKPTLWHFADEPKEGELDMLNQS
jgi:hypothetical protein